MTNHENIRNEPQYGQSTKFTVSTIIVLYVVIKFLYYLLAAGGTYWVARGLFGTFTLALLFIYNKHLRLSNRAASFVVPFTLALLESIICPLVDGDRLYFTFLIGTVMVSFIYVDAVGLLIHIGLANMLAIVFAFVMRLNMLGYRYGIDDALVQFLAFNMMNLVFYTICHFSVGKYRDFESTSRTYNMIMQTTPSYMVVTDGDTKVTYISKTLLEWLGLADSLYALGRPLIDLFSSGDMKMMFHEVLESDGYVEENFELTIDSKKYWFLLFSSPMGSGNVARFYEWIDITPVVEAKNEAESASKVKSNFLARMSHEIRTPMNAIVGMSELVLREQVPPTVHESTLSIKHAAANLLSIINDILDFSKIESGKLEIIPADYIFASLINDVVSIIRMRLTEKPILFAANIDCNIPNKLIGDEVRIRQILLNLLGNAVKYTNEGFISMTVDGIIENDTVILTIEISDSGVGIKEEDLGKLFGDFVQVDTISNRGVQGTGLGLGIAKSLCQSMGGDISVSSEYGVGSVFTVTLPQKFSTYEKFAAVENPGDKQVLIYEPRSIYANSIVCTIDNLGVRCTIVSNHSEFYNELKSNYYPFVFVSSFLLDNARHVIDRLHLDTKLVLMAEFGEVIADKNIRTAAMPVHSIAVANILNDVADSLSFRENQDAYVRFTAPDARVLIVDDMPTNLKVAEGLMAPYRMRIDTCKSGAEAVRLAKTNKYDAIFMDHMMPEMDGIEATAIIRGLENGDGYYSELPIIALTANAVSGVKEMFFKNGFSDFLAKPIDMFKLNGVLEKWIPRDKHNKYVEEPTAQMPTTVEIDGIDVNAGISMTGGTMSNYLKTLAIFHLDGLDKISEIKECLEKDDIGMYTTYVHAIKSASASIGAAEISECAKALENAGRIGQREILLKDTEDFLQKLRVLLENINSALAKPGAEQPNAEFPGDELNRLKDAIESMNVGEVESILNELDTKKLDETTSEAIRNISMSILLSEYDEALSLTGALLSTSR